MLLCLAGQGYVDAATIDATSAQEISKVIKGAGAQYLEAPVSGTFQSQITPIKASTIYIKQVITHIFPALWLGVFKGKYMLSSSTPVTKLHWQGNGQWPSSPTGCKRRVLLAHLSGCEGRGPVS